MNIRSAAPLLLVCAISGVFAATAFAQSAPTATLHVGDTSPQVMLLQQLLNESPDTAVATTGIGSVGLESTYFGAKTLDAVKRYQAKYRSTILVPAGLVSPTGIVGPLTLAQLQKGATTTIISTTSLPSSPPTTSLVSASSTSPVEQYISAVTQLGLQQGYSTTTLALIANSVRANATTTDSLTQFYKDQQALYKKQVSLEDAKPLAERFFDQVVVAVSSVLMPERAQASVGLPFGGYVAYVNPCTCTPNAVQVFISLPAPTPTSNLLLDYVIGSEGFNWHTLPTPGVATLGTYTPGALTCYVVVPDACVPMPAVGTITPETGSSATPL